MTVLLLLQCWFTTMPVIMLSMLMVSVVDAIGTRTKSVGSTGAAGPATSLIVAAAAATAVTVAAAAAVVVSTTTSNSNKTRTLSTKQKKAGKYYFCSLTVYFFWLIFLYLCFCFLLRIILGQPKTKKRKQSQPKLIGCSQDMSESKLSQIKMGLQHFLFFINSNMHEQESCGLFLARK